MIKNDFGDLTEASIVDEWPSFLIEWLHQDYLAGNRLPDIVINRLIYRDKATVKKMIHAEYERRGISDMFHIAWDTSANQAHARTNQNSESPLQRLKEEPTDFHI